MKQVRLIRHGQSAANAGQASVDHATIPLTLKGVEQAQSVARSFTHAPDLIVASPFFQSAGNSVPPQLILLSTHLERYGTSLMVDCCLLAHKRHCL